MSIASVGEQPNFTHNTPQDDDNDVVLDQMLAQAERLASEMRHLSEHSSSFSVSQSSLPLTIEMRDACTDCSSMEAWSPPSPEDRMSGHSNRKIGVVEEEGNLEEEKKCSDFRGDDLVDTVTEQDSTEGNVLNVSLDVSRSSTTGSLGSSAAEQQRFGVEAVVQASEEMQRCLGALKAPSSSAEQSPSRKELFSDSVGSGSSSPTSPFPISPEFDGDSKTTAKISHVYATPPKAARTVGSPPIRSTDTENSTSKLSIETINWASIERTKDLNKSAAKLAMSPHTDSSVKFEKMTLANVGDDDYVPMADYSSSPSSPIKQDLPRMTLDFSPDPLPDFSHHRVALRRRRKAKRRMRIALATLFAVVFVCFCLWKWSDIEILFRPEALKKPQAINETIPLPKEPTPEEIATERALCMEKAQTAKETAIRAVKAALASAEKATQEAEQRQSCSLPLAGVLSPICRQQAPLTGPEKRHFVEQLIDTMMQ